MKIARHEQASQNNRTLSLHEPKSRELCKKKLINAHSTIQGDGGGLGGDDIYRYVRS